MGPTKNILAFGRQRAGIIVICSAAVPVCRLDECHAIHPYAPVRTSCPDGGGWNSCRPDRQTIFRLAASRGEKTESARHHGTTADPPHASQTSEAMRPVTPSRR